MQRIFDVATPEEKRTIAPYLRIKAIKDMVGMDATEEMKERDRKTVEEMDKLMNEEEEKTTAKPPASSPPEAEQPR